MRTAVYAGSFDPLTKGYLWVIEYGSALFDRLIVCLGNNPEKRYTFSESERISMIESSCIHLSNVSVYPLGKDFLVNFSEKIGAKWLLRGIRNENDYKYEVDMRDENNAINPAINTTLVLPPLELRRVSSSFVKSLVGPTGWKEIVEKHLPPEVHKKFIGKYSDKEGL
ncbi:MAG: pantetheine-phosphate adenylyltransferase [Candidatus Yanofskybacteria bacterium RIFCSPHIGHO2_02_FULL_41_29]|uniref:Phosphopantetheine adenylyltransferase n=1 Tax=Candidatus Yanofskybacteria bacterium RIFCSPHIGHO2_01_FULL_41_53 TaxID=1802663 RepID=A0A1F8EJT6_9BACT|nr:MAG: pantetheine-phosphate adenylyltransferase [Candidatus Yanofskybacteria bacterium RIFCSPHIGHO2_01_FULL_41_53]OGN10781.1 MAG: pantetheine-phosphate adenylyltransferase [Candidatus Yanofskybacteria bacterium RIFCSPHIGHO2_02_FULL_41_29]OGN17072.1 MAG: pantetheine-phosphate adenylyltransferase [Candidatus Yanofskybacteria bacterium RIFCSPHIGHO2_12_FULL_41_9]OGN21802.1 MAG: pantetheine-phosphate adenylyltransferase [Candidatus Yanofskybacteria bacterium RIFCSPLOWO2_01_FULL_41_67]OGN29416.1 MA